MSSDRMGCRQLQNELPTFAFLVNQGLLNCESQTTDPQFQIDKNRKIVIFFLQQNKSNKSAHFAEKEREKMH